MTTNRVPAATSAAGRIISARIAALLVAGTALVAATGAGIPEPRANTATLPRQPGGGIEQQTSDLLVKAIQDPQATASVRAEAAALLVQRALSSETDRALVEELLRGPATEQSPSWYVLGGLSRQPTLPDWVFVSVKSLVPGADDRTQARALGVLGAVRSRESAGYVIEKAAGATSDAVRRAGYQALVRLTGRADLGEDPAAWNTWLDEMRGLSAEEWQARLVRGQARRADVLETARQATVARLVDAYRRIHFSLPADQRGDFLAGLLRDETDEVRSLGFELISRELSENVRLGGNVEAAAISLLRSPIASVRERAGLLVAQLSPAGAREAVKSALERETDAAAAAALLHAASRWPDESLLGVALQWLSRHGPALASSVDYIRSLVRAGDIQDPAERRTVLDAITAIPFEKFPPSACDVLVHLGDEDDRRTVARQLSSTNQAARFAAAQALLVVPDHVDDILLAAQNDPELFDIAVRAVSMYWPTAQGFRGISQLRAPSQEAWRRGLLKIAEMLPAPDLVEIIQSVEPNLREPLLANLTSPNRILSERYSTATFEALGRGLVQLARLRIDLGKPDAALAALDSLPELAVLEGEAVVNSLRAEALLCLGRIDDASVIPTDVDPWLAALNRSIDKPFARDLDDVITRRFAADLTEDQAARLATLRRRLASLNPSEAPGDSR